MPNELLLTLKALACSFRRYLGNVCSHLQYYRYEPNKPPKATFLKLTLAEQEAWIEANVPDWESNLYDDNYLGCSYQIDDTTVEEYLEYREDYGVSGLIEEQLPNIPRERIEEIDDGAELTNEELDALRNAMAANDFDGWDTHSGFYFKVRFGALYALYAGVDIGQGGSSFELECVFSSKRKALAYISSKPMAAVEAR